MKNINGKDKMYCICKVCLNKKAIVNEGKYQKWAQEKSLDSKLLGDIKKHKVDAEHMMQTLACDLKEKKLKEWAVKYMHKEFHRATIEWLVAIDQIDHITSDNASNNSMMFQEFVQHIRNASRKEFPWKKQKINCLAHVINLATYSKTPHFDLKNPEAHVLTTQDEVGLVHGITVKEQSSLKRKEIWRTIQTNAGVVKPVQLTLDMKVQ
ncbi:hypothetical protein C0995_016635 [Termitomyces sp. Mi166|nr:hypothetical protein C0995_016635 [Termitomyces sp. Mi166\